MLVKDIMNYGIEKAEPHLSLMQAAQKMKRCGTGYLLICDDEEIHGIVTNRDIVIRGSSRGNDMFVTTVADVMTPYVITCSEFDDLFEIANLMDKNFIRRMVVTDIDDKPIATLAIDDFFTWVLGEDALKRDYQVAYSEDAS